MMRQVLKVLVVSLFLVILQLRTGQADPSRYFVYPFASTSAYSNVWILGGSYGGHQGIDYPCPEGTPVYASISGTVLEAYDGETSKSCVNFGNTILISDGTYTVRYGHLLVGSVPFVKGDHVQAGWLVGKTSNTGYTFPTGGSCIAGDRSGGFHLHYEVRKVSGSPGLNPYAPVRRTDGTSDGGKDLFQIDSDGSFHFPAEVLPYTFTGHTLTCSDLPTSSAAGYSCRHPTDRFSLFLGPTVYTLVKLDQICEDFKLILEVYHNGTFEEKKEPFAFTDPGSSCWNNYYHTFETKPWTLGSWTHKLYLQIAGQPRVLLKEVSYLVDF